MGWFGGNKKEEEREKSRKPGTSSANHHTAPQRSAIPPQRSSSQQPVPNSLPQLEIPEPVMPPQSRTRTNPATPAEHGGDTVDEGLLIAERPPREEKQPKYDMEEASSRGAEEESAGEVPSYADAARQNHLNSLFNGHLMKWKFEAEEGSAFIRVPAFFGALGLIGTLIYEMCTQEDPFTSHGIVMGVCDIILSIFICILDGRFLATNPLSTRAHLRNILTRNFNMFRFVWGRGLLYIVAGVLNIAQMWLFTMCSGAYMVFVGLIAIIVGVHASRKFAALRNSLADESFLLLVFSNYDSDGDGYLAPNEFALLLADLGMELDDRYTLKAFNVIDTDSDRRVSFDEFNHWWASGYIERGRKRYTGEEDEDDTYRRMD